ncbi:MAG TPA: glycosyl hydrolase, partial [Sphingobacteriaceae bacterium]|nr:glycosyl hydrolase [Sphingobacteriaceae bacterium]
MKVFNICNLLLISTIFVSGCLPAQTAKVPGIVVAYSPASSGKYIGSPSIAIMPNGDYVASHDFFGPKSNENVRATSRIYSSSDKGKSWKQVAEIDAAFWSKLFVHKGILYFLGPDKHHGNTLIRKSTDGGKTWTEPTDKTHGLLLEGEYHCAPTPVIEYNGRLWRTMESAYGPVREWGLRYGAMMLSVPVDADLLNASNWTSSQPLLYDPTYLNGHFTGWLEGNAVATKDGKIVDILRVDDKTTLSEKAAIVHISA